MEVLGTGLSGLIGTRLVHLLKNRFNFTNLDLSTGVDVTDGSAVDKAVSLSKAEVIIHLAAYTNVSAAYEQNGAINGLCYQINVNGTKAVAQAARKYRRHLIHISTDFVFDGTKDDVYTEKDIPHPVEWYGETKLLAETIVQQTLPESDWTILRLAYPYQAKPNRPDFLAGIIEKLKNNQMPPAFTDHLITPTFVDDLAAVFAHLIRHKNAGIYHAVGASTHSDYEIANYVRDCFGLPGEIKPGKLTDYLKTNPRPYQQTMRISNEKLQKELGIRMKTFKEGLEEIRKQLMF